MHTLSLFSCFFTLNQIKSINYYHHYFIVCSYSHRLPSRQWSSTPVNGLGWCGNLWSQKDVIMSWLRLTTTSTCVPHPYQTWTKCLSTLICCPWVYSKSLIHSCTHITWLKFGVSWSLLWSQNVVSTSWLRLTATSHCFPHPYYTHTKFLRILIYCP